LESAGIVGAYGLVLLWPSASIGNILDSLTVATVTAVVVEGWLARRRRRVLQGRVDRIKNALRSESRAFRKRLDQLQHLFDIPSEPFFWNQCWFTDKGLRDHLDKQFESLSEVVFGAGELLGVELDDATSQALNGAVDDVVLAYAAMDTAFGRVGETAATVKPRSLISHDEATPIEKHMRAVAAATAAHTVFREACDAGAAAADRHVDDVIELIHAVDPVGGRHSHRIPRFLGGAALGVSIVWLVVLIWAGIGIHWPSAWPEPKAFAVSNLATLLANAVVALLGTGLTLALVIRHNMNVFDRTGAWATKVIQPMALHVTFMTTSMHPSDLPAAVAQLKDHAEQLERAIVAIQTWSPSPELAFWGMVATRRMRLAAAGQVRLVRTPEEIASSLLTGMKPPTAPELAADQDALRARYLEELRSRTGAAPPTHEFFALIEALSAVSEAATAAAIPSRRP